MIGTGTAAAEDGPSGASAPSQSTGLLGGLVGGVTGTLGGVLETTTTTVGQLTGSVLDIATSVLPPAASPPPPADPETQAPQREPAPIAKLARSVPHATVAVERPVRPAPKPAPAPPAVHKPAVPRAQVARPVEKAVGTVGTNQARPAEPVRPPGKAPNSPPAPVMPIGSVTSGHDGPGHARGCASMLAGQAPLEPPGEAFTTRNRATEAGDRPTGLPAASPD